MNRIEEKLSIHASSGKEPKKMLSIYFTAGYPQLDDTVSVIKTLEASGVDMIEIGLPFSDPLADGPTIQESSTQALSNGMTTEKLFEQLTSIRKEVEIPLLIMGYFNPMLQYGIEEFCKRCAEIGIDGLIIPDLPVDVFHREYMETFDKYGLYNVFLITPQTSDERIKYIDSISNGFIYMVSSASTTGAKNSFGSQQDAYFERINKLQLKTPQIVGFGISNYETFVKATAYANGAIVGSAFVKFLKENSIAKIPDFIYQLKEPSHLPKN
ncbi:tryptophan synthase subunit alpha [Lutimonas saemankumensis]|uniref:tryptophan synthase subunit alpha n=1 Tax=Lutimonas saemankumensis TaxID=483016 RepID=UPI001CD20F10|nr:tryptophan synthase subunit alpha [Lutimonas saemankumensis]MCA0932558.1 tryptophan synthase subunit alpha [Lutimonas saemankumensis]